MAITRIQNNQITDATITNVKILSQTLTGDLMNPNLTFNSNLTLNGNLVVTGNVTAVQSTTTQITDPLLTLGLGNAGTSYDLGLVLTRGSGGNRFIGWKENQGAFVFINTTEDGLTTGNIPTTAYSNVIFGNATTLGSSTFGGITLSGNTISAAGALTVRSDAGTVTIPNAAVVSGATILSSTLSVAGATTVDSLRSNAGIIATTGSFSSNLTGAALTSNASITAITTISALGGLQATPIGNVTPSTALFTTVGSSGNTTVSALTVNGTATIGSTLGVTGNINGSGITLTGSLVATGSGDFDGGLQSTPIGNATASSGAFTTLTASGITTITNSTDSTGASSGALQVTGGASINKNLYVTGNIYAGNIIAIQANTLSVQDPLLYLTANTPYPYNYSIGFFSQYVGGNPSNTAGNSYQHTGFVRDNADLTWKLFSNVVAEPGITVDFTDAQWEQVKHGNLIVVGTSSISGTLTANAGIQGTAIGNVTPSTALFTTAVTSGNATVSALTVNGTATIGSTLGVTGNVNGSSITLTGSLTAVGSGDFDGGLQSTPIGNAAASTGAFTTITSTSTITASGNIVAASGTASTGSTTGALVVIGGAGVSGTLNVQTAANLGNVTFNNLTISSNTTNQGLNINPNGTGVTTINSGLNNSRTVINGTSANTLVVSGTQVGVNTSSFISGATLQVNALDSMLLPVGATGDRPGSPVAGMMRYSTSQGTIEWYNGSGWSIPTGDFTVVVANSQVGNGTATVFTLPVANASTAGTIVSINGVVQQPTSAYSITGANVTFTEAPASTDTIDFRVFTTTAQVTEVVDIAGTTGLFFDLPTAGSQITTFKTAGTERFSIQANGTSRFTGNVEPSANVTYNLGSTTNRWNDLWLSGTTIYLGNIQIQNTTGDTVSFVTSSGTPAALNVDISDPSGIQSTPIGNATPSSGAFTTLSATGTFTGTTINAATIGNTGAALTGTLQTAAQTNITSVGTLSSLVVSGTSTLNGTVTLNNILPTANANANIGSTSNQFNTVFAKATSAQYADLAENYAADTVYEPGTVVHFGGSQEVTLCDEDMCRKVAGVVSTNPAYLMNSHLQGFAAAVALQGRVPCKVRGSIRKGDLMVSAGGGYARAEADPVVGSVIGKALENFDGLEGVIEVVVGRV